MCRVAIVPTLHIYLPRIQVATHDAICIRNSISKMNTTG